MNDDDTINVMLYCKKKTQQHCVFIYFIIIPTPFSYNIKQNNFFNLILN